MQPIASILGTPDQNHVAHLNVAQLEKARRVQADYVSPHRYRSEYERDGLTSANVLQATPSITHGG